MFQKITWISKRCLKTVAQRMRRRVMCRKIQSDENHNVELAEKEQNKKDNVQKDKCKVKKSEPKLRIKVLKVKSKKVLKLRIKVLKVKSKKVLKLRIKVLKVKSKKVLKLRIKVRKLKVKKVLKRRIKVLKSATQQESVHTVQTMKTVMCRKKRSIVNKNNIAAKQTASKLLNSARSKVKGSWAYVNKERADRAKATKCFLCGEQKDTLMRLEKHLRKKHSSYRFKCRYCKRKYLTRGGRNKHLLYHTVGLRYNCPDCSKGFMFKGEYNEHRSKHTGRNRFMCTKRGCDKDYGSKRARDYHVKQHKAKALYCDFQEKPGAKKCGHKCFSRQHLDQHFRGAHGPGWDALCGKHYTWPAPKIAHEKECTECIRKKKKRKCSK